MGGPRRPRPDKADVLGKIGNVDAKTFKREERHTEICTRRNTEMASKPTRARERPGTDPPCRASAGAEPDLRLRASGPWGRNRPGLGSRLVARCQDSVCALG